MKFECTTKEFFELISKPLSDAAVNDLKAFLQTEVIKMTDAIDNLAASEQAEDQSNQQLRDVVGTLIPAITNLVPAVNQVIQNAADLKAALNQALDGVMLSDADKTKLQSIINSSATDTSANHAVVEQLNSAVQSVAQLIQKASDSAAVDNVAA